MSQAHSRLDTIAFGLLCACLGIVQFNLLAAQVLFGLALILWLVLVIDERRLSPVPSFFWPLAAYGAMTLVSALASLDRRASLIDSRQLVLFFMVPMVARFMRGDRAMTSLNVIIAMGAAGAVLGVAEYTMFGFDNLGRRPTGSLSHYMTYSGVIMLVLGAALARLLFHTGPIVWPAIAVPALLVALAVTYARNAWIGALVAGTCLLAVRRPKLVWIVPALVGVFLVVAPADLRYRATSMFDPTQESNRDRLQMLAMGGDMVRDYPILGTGPEMVQRVYGQYLRPNPVHTYNPHLHNVPVQIAAERGLIAFGVWCWFVVAAAVANYRQLRHGPARAVAGAGLAAVVAMLAAGLFEYNFGDSEFLMLFLGLVTLPFAARRDTDATAARRA